MGKDVFVNQWQQNKKKKIVYAKLQRFYIRNGRIRLKFSLDGSEGILQSLSIILRSAIQKKQYDFAVTSRRRGDKLICTAELSLNHVEWEQFYWDIRGRIIIEGEECELRIRNRSQLLKILMLVTGKQTFLQEKKYVVYPYLTNSNDPAIQYRARSKQDRSTFILKEYLALLIYYLLRPYWLSKKYG